jgi:hypothetical protein
MTKYCEGNGIWICLRQVTLLVGRVEKGGWLRFGVGPVSLLCLRTNG